MPGVDSCGRCGATLCLDSMAVDIHPPRAGRKTGNWRRWYGVYLRVNRLRDIAGATMENGGFGGLVMERPPRALMLRMIVPGWPQFHTGRPIRGRIMLWGYLAALLLAAVFFGSPLGGVLLGAVLTLHVSCVLDVVFAGTSNWRLRTAYSLLCLMVLATITYLPGQWLVTRVAVPQQVVRANPPIQEGDVFIYNPSAYNHSAPQVGDVVVYDIPRGRVQVPRGDYFLPAVYAIQGNRIDRVLAGPGQTVEVIGGELRVDGASSPWLPLSPGGLSTSFTLTVPEGRCLILPSTDPLIPPSDLKAFALVPLGSVLGRVYLRNLPLWRFWFVC